MSEISRLWAVIGADLTGLTSGLASAKNQLTSAGQSMTQTGAMLTAGVTLPLLGIGTAAAKAATDFERELRNIQSISKDSDEATFALGERFLAMSQNLAITRDSAANLAAGFYQIQSSGFAGEEAMTVLEAATKAASAGLTTTEVTAKSITAILNAYGMEASEAAHVSDVLFRAGDVGVFSFEEIAGTIGDVIGTSAAAGVSIEEVAAGFATMTKSGISANEAATSLNQLMLSYISPSKEAAKAAAAMGIDLSAAALSSQGLSGVIQELATHTDMWAAVATNADAPLQAQLSSVEASEEALKRYKLELESSGQLTAEARKQITQQAAALKLQRMDIESAMESNVDYNMVMQTMAESTGLSVEQLAALFPNVRALRGALSLAREEGTAFASDLEAIGGAAGATAAAFEIQSKSFAAQMDSLKNKGTAIFIELGMALLPHLLAFADSVMNIVSALKTANPEWVKWALVIGGVLAALGPVMTIGGLLLTLLGALLTPIGLLVGALALLGLAYATNFGGLRDTVNAVVPEVMAALAGFAAGLVEALSPAIVIVQNVAAFVASEWPKIQASAEAVFGKVAEIVGVIMPLVESFINGAVSRVVTWWLANWPQLSATASAILTELHTYTMAVLTNIQNFWQAHGAQILAFAQGLWSFLVNAIGGFIKLMASIILAVLQGLNGDWRKAWDTFLVAVLTFAIDLLAGVEEFLNGIATAMGTSMDEIRTTWSENWEMLKIIVEDMVRRAVAWLKARVADFRQIGADLLNGMRDGILGAVSGVIAAATGAVTSAIDAAKSLLGISSPSRVFADIGRNVMAGMAEGIERGAIMPQVALAGANGAMLRQGTPSVSNTTQNTFYLTAQYRYQDERTLSDDVRQLQLLGAGL
jgi:TP901 family phage tail tape measure protein